MHIIKELVKRIRNSGVRYNREIQVKPSCILWTDAGREWEPYIPMLRTEIPELLILGDYNPQDRTGPGIWLRYIIANTNPDVIIPEEYMPIIYIPGVSRQDLRAVERCSDEVMLLAELQYRGVYWSQANTRDWTLFAFLSSEKGGLGLNVSPDGETKKSIYSSFNKLLQIETESLRGRLLDSEFFDNMLTPDYMRNLLEWINDDKGTRGKFDDNSWESFVRISKGRLGFNPETDGVLTGATMLANHNDMWRPVWDRFCEAPHRYENIPNIIRKCAPSTGMNWANPEHDEYEGWPQWNEIQENSLRDQLCDISNYDSQRAKEIVEELYHEHSHRKKIIWTSLGASPLVLALEHLHDLSEATNNGLNNGNIADLEKGYSEKGWFVDFSVVQALSCVSTQEDIEAVSAVINSVYKPWAEDSARYLQKIIDEKKNEGKFRYPKYRLDTPQIDSYEEGDCVLFVDALRFDLGKRLVDLLTSNCVVKEQINWAALPSITATAKPAISPIQHKIIGGKLNNDFTPKVSEIDKPVTSHYFKKVMKESAWTILKSSSITSAGLFGWCEFGDIDHIGHDRGWELVYEVDRYLSEIVDLVIKLFKSGWKRIHIVTDHGWLLMPKSLPKTALPKILTETKWGRCAILKPGVKSDQREIPWYWNSVHHFVGADGISCFKKGNGYDHGGISLQECLTLKLTVTPGDSIVVSTIHFRDITWRGMRCTIGLDGNYERLSVDIRTKPADPISSIVFKITEVRDDGTASVLVENEDLHGDEVYIVLLDQEDNLVSQNKTKIGV
jgi:hypothetical protein